MDIFSESVLEREGARAAAQGQSWRSNPFLQAQNMPQATGESLGDWSRRHDAWQRGFEGYFQLGAEFARRRKEELSAQLLKTLLERRLQWLPSMRAYMAKHPQFVPKIPLPPKHPRDGAGRDWDLEDFERDAMNIAEIDTELRSIVDRLRGQYDILSPTVAAGVPSGMEPCTSSNAAGDRQLSNMDGQSPGRPCRADTTAALMEPQSSAAPQHVPDAAEGAADLAPIPDDQQLRAELGIRRIGWRYEYLGYRYDRLSDAVAYAKLGRDVPPSEAALGAGVLADEPPPMPSEEDRALMLRWGIEFEAGIYTFKGYRYERLGDAVAYAALLAGRKDEADGPGAP
jgi:hypothetical protein